MRFRVLRSIAAAVLAAALTGSIARAETTTVSMDNPITQAREKVASGDMSGAISYLQTYIETHPRDISARRFLGDLYFRVGNVDSAAVVYEQILRDDPEDKQTHNRLGTVYAEENRVDDAIREFDAALPGTDSVTDLVELHERKGDLGAYEARIAGVAESETNDAGAQTEMGQLFDALHLSERAIPFFLRALDDRSDDLTALNGLGLAYLNLHRFTEAIPMFERCLRVDSFDYQCQNNLGAADLEMGRLTDAKTALDRALSLEPERGETYVNYGYLADEQGDWQKAASQYAKAIETYPYLKEAYVDLALDYEHHGLYVLAQAVLIKGIASVHDDGRLHVLLGQAYEAQGNRIDAVTQFRLGRLGTDPTAASIATEQLSQLSPAATATPQ
jgi:tetratricopeptide (TPR) repeat protein